MIFEVLAIYLVGKFSSNSSYPIPVTVSNGYSSS